MLRIIFDHENVFQLLDSISVNYTLSRRLVFLQNVSSKPSWRTSMLLKRRERLQGGADNRKQSLKFTTAAFTWTSLTWSRNSSIPSLQISRIEWWLMPRKRRWEASDSGYWPQLTRSLSSVCERQKDAITWRAACACHWGEKVHSATASTAACLTSSWPLFLSFILPSFLSSGEWRIENMKSNDPDQML